MVALTRRGVVNAVVIHVSRSLNLLEPELPANAIGSVTTTVARVYRIVPVSLADDELTVAADKPLSWLYLDELRWFVPVKTIKAVTVSEEHLNLALDHYYSLELEAEIGPFVRAVCMVLKPDVVQVRLTTVGSRTRVHITRRDSSETMDASPRNELSPNAVARLKELAGIDAERAAPQQGAISLGEGDQRAIIDVEARLEADAETLILTVRERHPVAEGG